MYEIEIPYSESVSEGEFKATRYDIDGSPSYYYPKESDPEQTDHYLYLLNKVIVDILA